MYALKRSGTTAHMLPHENHIHRYMYGSYVKYYMHIIKLHEWNVFVCLCERVRLSFYFQAKGSLPMINRTLSGRKRIVNRLRSHTNTTQPLYL